MILIADSGSTKTHWHLLDSNKIDFFTHGINPFYQTEKDVYNIFRNEISFLEENISQVYFLELDAIMKQKKEKLRLHYKIFGPIA